MYQTVVNGAFRGSEGSTLSVRHCCPWDCSQGLLWVLWGCSMHADTTCTQFLAILVCLGLAVSGMLIAAVESFFGRPREALWRARL